MENLQEKNNKAKRLLTFIKETEKIQHDLTELFVHEKITPYTYQKGIQDSQDAFYQFTKDLHNPPTTPEDILLSET